MKRIMRITFCNTRSNIIHKEHHYMLAAVTCHSKGATDNSGCYLQHDTVNISLGIQSKCSVCCEKHDYYFLHCTSSMDLSNMFLLKLDLFLPSGIKVGPLREKYCESPYQLGSLARSLVQLVYLERVSHISDQ